MIAIVGGTYRERCAEPRRDDLYGSGGRAAAALSALDTNVTLHTARPRQAWGDLRALAATFGFKVEAHDAPHTVEFAYFHPLSVPDIVPPLHQLRSAEPFEVHAESVLRFGMLEADPVVRGERVVYDPHDVRAPRHYHANGSSASRLAYVLNRAEARQLAPHAPHDDPEALARTVARDGRVDVVVIKLGAQGALVLDEAGGVTSVPAYRTPSVWPIGSGDVFSAVFAYHWAVAGLPAVDAARQASLSTAYAYHQLSLPVPADLPQDTSPKVRVGPQAHRIKQVYLAGPFFTMGKRWVVGQALVALRAAGFKVFSPLHDVGHGPAEDVVEKDLRGLDESDLVFAVIDGLDAGTLFEFGYAHARRKPVGAFVQNESAENMKMLRGSSCVIESDFASAVYAAVWEGLAQ
ncbi:PfkB family carbohydrate kinase [Deinococcus pimensis]|uniref:PfkB family carbohydrate kinase n=1 Tax=Deinococcus pimensis TaxID=309888 RepID=UPI000487F3E0|nr:PfkB family carbohydrate kinase [Deinococcus pimensis]